MKADFETVEWNLSRFAPLAHKYPEFRLGKVPDGEALRIVGVAHQSQGRTGSIELVDGAHRIVAMMHRGVATVPAYIGEFL